MSLGLVRFLLQGCIDISTALNVDAMERATVAEPPDEPGSLPHLHAGCPTCTNGETVFRWTSVGRDWDTTNAIGIQHIFPGSQIGLSSDSNLLQIANNMIGAMARWNDGNGTRPRSTRPRRASAIAPGRSSRSSMAGSRTIHIPTSTSARWAAAESRTRTRSRPTVAEMMLQSFQGTILRVFPNWPSGSNAKFCRPACLRRLHRLERDSE